VIEPTVDRQKSRRLIGNGHQVLWQTTDDSSAQPVLMAGDADLLVDLLSSFSKLFAEPIGLPPQRDLCHEICLLPGTPQVAMRPYRYAYIQKQELECQCASMLQTGIIRPSTSSFSAPVLLVKKGDGSWRFCVDYQALNAAMIKDKFPIPVVEELLDKLHDAAYFTKLDLRSGYHQVRMHPDDVTKTAFRSHKGLFKFLVMSFSLTNASAMFQTLMNTIIRLFLHRFVLVFFNDILIYSSLWSEHLWHVHLVLTALQENKLFIKKSKCAFGTRSVAYLGHVISEQGVTMDHLKVQAVIDWPVPCTVRAVRLFLSLVGYYRRFTQDYGAIAEPLTRLLRKEGFKWTPEAEGAFRELHTALTRAPVLQLPTFDCVFIVECNTSGAGFGTVLHQAEGPVAFFNRKITPRHTKLAVYERKLIGLVQVVHH
jgi:hypothetical protein